jgi:hypothetical protein
MPYRRSRWGRGAVQRTLRETDVRTFVAALVLVAVCGCASKPLIYDQDAGLGAPAIGSVTPLAKIIGPDTRDVTVIFVHGVGDHCPAYAIDSLNPDQPKQPKAWFRDDIAKKLGFTPLAVGTWGDIPAKLLTYGLDDPASHVHYETRNYEWAADASRTVKVQAIEITWSPLTSWLKTAQVGYDSPSVFPAPNAPNPNCIWTQQANDHTTLAPPPRVSLNRDIKEDVLDRELADALIYTSPYGKTIRRGVAEVLCHVLIPGQPNDQHCIWPGTQHPQMQLVSKPAYIFVTHSLGSRMVFDTLNELARSADEDHPLIPHAAGDTRPLANAVIDNTRVIYMQANQITLLSLGIVPCDAYSGGPQQRLILEREQGIKLTSNCEPARADSTRPTTANTPSTEPPNATGTGKTLHLVAFNDANDLLSWHLPRWYALPLDHDPTRSWTFSNVFVQNAPHILDFVESPIPAHDNYFINGDVWDVIKCGATAGIVDAPC